MVSSIIYLQAFEMCAINFIYSPLDAADQLKEKIILMSQVTQYRGPDKTSIYSGINFCLGFNRLEITGGPEAGQPIIDPDTDMVLICNGEIYNHQELKNRFFPKAHFRGTSDCEIILHLYKKFGSRSFQNLEGQYAFVLVNRRKNEIIFGRDPFGISPLYYYQHNGRLIISSEIKGIFRSGFSGSPKLDPLGIAQSRFFYGPIPSRTTFKNVHQLPPGYAATYSGHNDSLVIYQANDVFMMLRGLDANHESPAEDLYEVLEQSVRNRLQGDFVPGLYLSGGIDSSIVAYLVNKLSQYKPIAFSLSFDEQQYDESYYQKLVAKAFDIPLVQVHAALEDILSRIQDAIWHVEGPLIRSAPIPLLILSAAARERGVKYVLCGEGADEVFAGYPVFEKHKASFEDKWASDKSALQLFKNSIKDQIYDSYNKLASLNFSARRSQNNQIKEMQTKLSQYLLVQQGDRVSMANSVEQRFPFLDSNVVRLGFGLDQKELYDQYGGKAILRKTFRDVIPSKVLTRKKQGYLTPDVRITQAILASQELQDYLSPAAIEEAEIFNVSEVQQVIEGSQRGRLNEERARTIIFALTTQLLHHSFKGIAK